MTDPHLVEGGSPDDSNASGPEFAGTLRFGHSPDPDDAFMFYGFEAGGVHVEVREPGAAVTGPHAASPRAAGAAPPRTGAATAPLPGSTRRWRVEHLLEDIQSLNERALSGELEMTAVSAHAYPFVAERYWVMRTGVSMGDGYGPIVVARQPTTLQALRGARIAVPGMMTTGLLALKLRLEEFRPVLVRFDRILDAVRDGEAEAGIVIHEGQLTWSGYGLYNVADLGALWKEETGFPLPLGLDLVRKDLGRPLAEAASDALRRSIEFARAHQGEAIRYALQYGRGLDEGLGTRFVDMYVNDWTLDLGEKGRKALSLLWSKAADAGLVPEVRELVVV